MRRLGPVLFGATFLSGMLACAPSPEPRAQVANAVYHGVYEHPVRVTDGRYEGEPFQPGAASRPTVTLLAEPRASGDLDGDGIDDTVVLLAENSGGSGVFVYLAVVGWQSGKPVNLATRLLGDRVQVSTLEAEGGQIRLELAERSGGERRPATTLSLLLVDGELVEPTAQTEAVTHALRGRLVWGHEVRSFTECGSSAADWFVDATGGGVRSAYETLATEPYEPLLFEVRGTVGPPPETGFGADYARTLTIDEVVRAERASCEG